MNALRNETATTTAGTDVKKTKTTREIYRKRLFFLLLFFVIQNWIKIASRNLFVLILCSFQFQKINACWEMVALFRKKNQLKYGKILSSKQRNKLKNKQREIGRREKQTDQTQNQTHRIKISYKNHLALQLLIVYSLEISTHVKFNPQHPFTCDAITNFRWFRWASWIQNEILISIFIHFEFEKCAHMFWHQGIT